MSYQQSHPTLDPREEHFEIPGPRQGLRLFLRRLASSQRDNCRAVLYVHGATFPSALSIAHRFSGGSWRDALSAAGFDVWGFDFYGFGFSDRYPEMSQEPDKHPPLCIAEDAAEQLHAVVRFILAHLSLDRLSIISHSWGSMPVGRFASAHPTLLDRWILFGPIAKRAPRRYENPPSFPAWRLVSLEDQFARFTEDVPAPPHASGSHALGALAREHRLSPREWRVPVLGPIAGGRSMFSVIFEVNRKPDRANDYLELAKHLQPILANIDGFIDNERFESKGREGWLLSHSTWRDEKSVIRWRTEAEHHQVQEKGRLEIFQDYHLRVGEVVSDSAPPPNVPIRELRFDETEAAAAKYATLTEITPQAKTPPASASNMLPAHLGLDTKLPGLVGHDIFASIATPGKLAILASWKDAKTARSWEPRSFDGVKALRHRIVRVIRDYGMFDRREAPQYYPPA